MDYLNGRLKNMSACYLFGNLLIVQCGRCVKFRKFDSNTAKLEFEDLKLNLDQSFDILDFRVSCMFGGGQSEIAIDLKDEDEEDDEPAIVSKKGKNKKIPEPVIEPLKPLPI